MLKKLILSLAALSLVLVSSPALAFSDVDSTTPYQEAIEWFAEEGVIEGFDDGTFKPDVCVKRTELLKMVYLSDELVGEDNSVIDFSDVNYSEWYAKYVNFFNSKYIIEGYKDGIFRPASCVKRTEAMKIAFWEFNNQPVGISNFSEIPFPQNIVIDEKNWQWWYSWVGYGFKNSFVPIDHLPQDLTDPDHIASLNIANYDLSADMTRGEVAEMLYRLKAAKDNSQTSYTPDLIPLSINRIKTVEPVAAYDEVEDCTTLGDDWYRATNITPTFDSCIKRDWEHNRITGNGASLSFKTPGTIESPWEETGLNETHVLSAESTKDDFDQNIVNIYFNNEGTELFTAITRDNIGRQLAIFVDGELVSAPTIATEIWQGQAIITGNFTKDEAQELAEKLTETKRTTNAEKDVVDTDFGRTYYLQLNDSLSSAPQAPFVVIATSNYFNYGDRDGAEFGGWGDLSLDKTDEELARLFKPTYGFSQSKNTKVKKYSFKGKPAYLVTRDIISPDFTNKMINISHIYMPYVEFNGDLYHLQLIGETLEQEDLIKYAKSLSF